MRTFGGWCSRLFWGAVCVVLLFKGASMAGSVYSVSEMAFGSGTVVVLKDGAQGQEARILPGVGNNCVVYRVSRQGAGAVDVIFSPPDPETLQGRPSGYGVPILFPWPNRIEGGQFAFDGKTYHLDTPAPGGHASHGFVLNRPWTVEATGASDAEGAWVRSRFRAADFPEVMRQFPFAFEAVATYRLKDGALSLAFEGINAGTADMPAGLGIHPYFPLPLTEAGDRDVCTAQMPAEQYWPLKGDPIPTGEVLPVSGVFDLRTPTALKGRFYDHVWTGVRLTDGWSRCEYRDPVAKVTVAMEADAHFRELVLYAPEQRPVLCFEPYTCVTNAVNLQAQGVDAGLIRLKPGERMGGVMRLVPGVE